MSSVADITPAVWRENQALGAPALQLGPTDQAGIPVGSAPGLESAHKQKPLPDHGLMSGRGFGGVVLPGAQRICYVTPPDKKRD